MINSYIHFLFKKFGWRKVFFKKNEIENVSLHVFIREKKNRSGSISVVVVSKQSGRYREVYMVGVSSDSNPSTIDKLREEGLLWIRQQTGLPDMFDLYKEEQLEKETAEFFFRQIENILINGTLLILNQVFKLIGFDQVEDDVFRQLVVSRICQPLSKVATVEYLKSHFDEDVHPYKLYEYMDKLHDVQKDRVEQISVDHTRKILGGKIGLVFYDVSYAGLFIIPAFIIIILKYRLLNS